MAWAMSPRVVFIVIVVWGIRGTRGLITWGIRSEWGMTRLFVDGASGKQGLIEYGGCGESNRVVFGHEHESFHASAETDEGHCLGFCGELIRAGFFRNIYIGGT